MKHIIEAIAESSNLVFLLREGSSDQAALLKAADKVMSRLEIAIDSIVALKETRNANAFTCACSTKGICSGLRCSKNDSGTPP